MFPLLEGWGSQDRRFATRASEFRDRVVLHENLKRGPSGPHVLLPALKKNFDIVAPGGLSSSETRDSAKLRGAEKTPPYIGVLDA